MQLTLHPEFQPYGFKAERGFILYVGLPFHSRHADFERDFATRGSSKNCRKCRVQRICHAVDNDNESDGSLSKSERVWVVPGG